MALSCQLPGAVKPVVGDVRALAVALVAPVGLTQRVVRTRHVEDVVHDLEQDAELRSVAPIGGLGDAVNRV